MQQVLLPLVVLGLMMYFIILRPQRRVKAQRAALMSALAPGDEIVTIGGLYARVDELQATTVDLEIAEGVIVRFDRRAISSIVPAASQADAVEEDDDLDEDDPVVDEADPVSDTTR